MKTPGTLLLDRSDIFALLTFEECVRAVEEAFRLRAQGRTLRSGLMHVNSVDGEFHVKAGGVELSKRFFAFKINGGFFNNMERFDMPNIQGAILLFDGENGYPLAVMDSTEITMKRTGAAAAIAARYLARPESSILTICGCGVQGSMQLKAMKYILPIEKVYAFDSNRLRAESFAKQMSEECGIQVVATDDVSKSLKESDVCVTCTPSRRHYIDKKAVSAGTFIAAMGADSPEKQELDPEILKSSKIVVDILEQCVQFGELHHAIDHGMSERDVYAELGEIIAGNKPGRISKDEIIVFDATGTALQDVAAAAAVYEKAIQRPGMRVFDFFR
jgi:alanine dehydrogenase